MKKPGASFAISNFWGPREETPKALASRIMMALKGLKVIDPVFTSWFVGKEGRGVSLTLTEGAIQTEIAREAGVDGLTLFAKTELRGSGTKNFNFDVWGGAPILTNRVVLRTDYGHEPDPSVINYRLFKQAILAIAEAFQVERAFAYPTSIFDLRPPHTSIHPPFPISWISYVTPRLTHLVTPPTTAIIEHRPDGGLLMSATDDVFDVGNELHMSVARDIAAGAKALHGRPWEPE